MTTPTPRTKSLPKQWSNNNADATKPLHSRFAA